MRRLELLPCAAVLALLGTLVLVPSAQAVMLQCLPRTAVVESLGAANGEQPAHVGLASNGALLEVTVAPDGSWTAFFSFPDGLACPIAAGEGWRAAPGGDDDDEPAA